MKNVMNIGIKTSFNPKNLKKQFQEMVNMGIYSCQLSVGPDLTMFENVKENAEYVLECVTETEVTISSVWAGWSGPREWNFSMGPETLGLVPTAYRAMRYEEMLRASEFTEMIGVENMVTHVGFIPENMNDPLFAGTVGVLRNLCKIMKERGQYFLFETGQETPVTLLRTIEAIGTGNLGVNLDTANLILYGKANPVDALDVIGKYVRDTHCKDGFYPACGSELGREVRMGEGKVDFYGVIKGLHELGYQGSLTIEREILGEEQTRDILHAKKLLEDIKMQLGID